MIALPDTGIADRWLGHYAHLPGADFLKLAPAEDVTAVTFVRRAWMAREDTDVSD